MILIHHGKRSRTKNTNTTTKAETNDLPQNNTYMHGNAALISVASHFDSIDDVGAFANELCGLTFLGWEGL